MREFDKEFEKARKNAKRAFWVVLTVNVLISVGVLSGIAWVVYVSLKHFGIVG